MPMDRSQIPAEGGHSRQQRLGRALLKGWLVIALIYVTAAAAFSIAPVRAAIGIPATGQVASQRQPEARGDAHPDPPPSRTVRIGRAVTIQAAITFAPPLLALWFGWDVWFAVIGFLPDRAACRTPAADEGLDPKA